jgi:hypothetical protein
MEFGHVSLTDKGKLKTATLIWRERRGAMRKAMRPRDRKKGPTPLQGENA